MGCGVSRDGGDGRGACETGCARGSRQVRGVVCYQGMGGGLAGDGTQGTQAWCAAGRRLHRPAVCWAS